MLQLVAPLEVADTVVTAVARSVKHVAVIAVGSHVYVNHVAVIAVGLQAGVSQFFFLQSLQLVGMWLCSMFPSLQMVFLHAYVNHCRPRTRIIECLQ